MGSGRWSGRWRCYDCGFGAQFLEWVGDGECPKCGRKFGGPGKSRAGVQPLTDVHLVTFADDGPVLGLHGRLVVACQPKRDGLALYPGDDYAATDDPRAVTCPSCRGTPAWKALAEQFPEIMLEETLRRSRGMTVEKGKARR